MMTLFLICFVLGLVVSILGTVSGLGHLHIGHLHFGHAKLHVKTQHAGSHLSAINGFTLPAFLCWFGAAGYLLLTHSSLVLMLVLLCSTAAGIFGAGIIYVFLFKFLLPRERILSPEDTRMDGVVARVSDEIREGGGIGEVLFTQLGARRGAPAKSEDGKPIPRGTEVVVLRYAKGIAYVSPLDELAR